MNGNGVVELMFVGCLYYITSYDLFQRFFNIKIYLNGDGDVYVVNFHDPLARIMIREVV
jgi:hypothetical protein